MKKIITLLSLSCVLYTAQAATQEMPSLGSLLASASSNTLTVPAVIAGTITFSDWTSGNITNATGLNWYSDGSCTAHIGSINEIMPDFTPLNVLYYIDGTALYSMATNYGHFDSGTSAADVQSFTLAYYAIGSGGTSANNGSTGQCYCYTVNVSGGNTYQGSGEATGITYLPSSFCTG